MGCSFFDIEDAGKPIIPKKSTSASKAGAPASGGTGGSAGTGTGTGGSASGSGGSGGTNASGSGGSSGSSVGGEATMAGSGGSAGSAVMAGAGDGSGGMPALGGMGGMAGNDMSMAGSGMVAGSSAGGSGPISDCAGIKSDAKSFGGHCYLLVTNAVNFDAAKNDCMSMQAHLVTISNGDPESKDTFDAEDTFVYGLAGGKDTWLGLADGKKDRDPGDGTPYKWIDGEPSPPDGWGTAYGWQSGEPNNYQKNCTNGDTCYEHCGFMLSDQGDKWNDDLCESTKQYVCEWDTLPTAMGK